jgi:hypothetical protein
LGYAQNSFDGDGLAPGLKTPGGFLFGVGVSSVCEAGLKKLLPPTGFILLAVLGSQ